MVRTHLSGIHPRSEELVEATRRADRGKVEKGEVDRLVEADVRSLARVQAEAGITDPCAGNLDWQDIFRPLAESSEGVEIGAVTRFFDTNSFYRQPTITGEVRANGIGKRREIRVLGAEEEKGGKRGKKKGAARPLGILPGPYSFAALALDHHYPQFAERLASLSRVVASAAEQFVKKGAAHLLLVDPALVARPPTRDQWPQVKEAVDRVTKGLGVATTLHTQFGDFAPVASHLIDLRADAFSVDFFSTELDALKLVKWDRGLVVGAIDGRNSLLEEAEDVAGFARKAREALEPRSLSLAPSCALEYLPRSVADEKVKVLGAAAALLGGD